MHFDKTSINSVRAVFGDAVFTFYKTFPQKKPADIEVPSIYHSHVYYECHILISGDTRFTIENDVIYADSGTIFIIPPYTEHHPFREEGEAREIVLGFTLERQEILQEQESRMFQYFRDTLGDIALQPILLSPELLADLMKFHDGFGSNSLRDVCLQQAAAYGIIVQFFDFINQFHIYSDVSKPDSNDNVDITLDLMLNEVRYSLKDIARALGYSTRHTSRLILKKYGRSLMEIRQQNMITTAKKFLLSAPTLPLDVIARQSGFSSVDAMIRIFRRWENVTPLEYRKMQYK